MDYSKEIAECRRRMALGISLNGLLNNPDFKAVINEGYLHHEIVRRGLNINVDKSGTIQFLKAASAFKEYLDYVKRDAEQAQVDLNGYLNISL
jgi:predicted transcriptional regulator